MTVRKSTTKVEKEQAVYEQINQIKTRDQLAMTF
jgi:hypothetical protein